MIATAGLCVLPAVAGAGPLFTAPYMSFGAGGRPFAVASADMNRDGFPDLVVANQTTSSVTVLLGFGDGTLAARGDFFAGVSPISVAIADLNHDTKPDVVVANLDGNTVSVLMGVGDGSLAARVSYPTGLAAFCVVIADLNGDSKHDLVVANERANDALNFIKANGHKAWVIGEVVPGRGESRVE